ncbi:hypothetical protein GOBAR_DD06375 [Gossypium barbadense]|nr:hypothetical protein GOBAR_DD06375 [Gossypium barbadense]
MSRRSGTCLRLCLVTFALISALAVCGPALYWRFKKTLKLGPSKSSCPPCICDCPHPLSLVNIAPGLTNLSIASPEKGRTCYIYINDIMASLVFGQYYLLCRNLQLVGFLILCGSNDPDLKQEMEKQFLDLLTEELKLQETVAEEHSRHMNITFGEAKKGGFPVPEGGRKMYCSHRNMRGSQRTSRGLANQGEESNYSMGAKSSTNGLGRGINCWYNSLSSKSC